MDNKRYCAHHRLEAKVSAHHAMPYFVCRDCGEPFHYVDVVALLNDKIESLERRLDELYDEVQTLRTH